MLMKRGVIIKKKIHHPFIYFFFEPNTVIVYKIETQIYLTVYDLRKHDCDIYKINAAIDFEYFHHENYEPAISYSYFINVDLMVEIVEEINLVIQDYLRKNFQKPEGPYHIVCFESTAGSLNVGLPRPKTVIAIPDNLSYGPLGKLDKKEDRKIREEWLYENINDELEEGIYTCKFSNSLRQIEDISESVPIYLWCGNNAAEQIGLRFMLYLLRKKKNTIYLLGDQIEEKKADISFTSQMDSKQIKSLFERNKESRQLSLEERSYYSEEWLKLIERMEVLRIWNDGEILGVPESFFDSLILEILEGLHAKQTEKDFIPVGEVIREMLISSEANINLFFLEYRIRQLIYNGSLYIKGIPKSIDRYKVKLH